MAGPAVDVEQERGQRGLVCHGAGQRRRTPGQREEHLACRGVLGNLGAVVVERRYGDQQLCGRRPDPYVLRLPQRAGQIERLGDLPGTRGDGPARVELTAQQPPPVRGRAALRQRPYGGDALPPLKPARHPDEVGTGVVEGGQRRDGAQPTGPQQSHGPDQRGVLGTRRIREQGQPEVHGAPVGAVPHEAEADLPGAPGVRPGDEVRRRPGHLARGDIEGAEQRVHRRGRGIGAGLEQALQHAVEADGRGALLDGPGCHVPLPVALLSAPPVAPLFAPPALPSASGRAVRIRGSAVRQGLPGRGCGQPEGVVVVGDPGEPGGRFAGRQAPVVRAHRRVGFSLSKVTRRCSHAASQGGNGLPAAPEERT
ncbi:hypothetical protein OG533_21855 [Streptomyces sp. NBC_01186]|uniref:hypothetical protein n=1 Tax=Streptomyces sp. NBC_01186 TaxID=2903765 RepID=UPI002E13B55E|nr:hypothetical protein OG533_21855 [Streptomyces sp. NBC_01186]